MTGNDNTGSEHSEGSVSHLEDELLNEAMDTLDAFLRDVNTTVTLEAGLVARCPLDGDRTDEYDLTVEYEPDGYVIETGAFREFLDLFEEQQATQEAICTFLHRVLLTHFDPEWITVRLEGEHDGIQVTTEKTRGDR